MVRLVQGELGYDHDLNVDCPITMIGIENRIMVKWPAFEGDPPYEGIIDGYDVRRVEATEA